MEDGLVHSTYSAELRCRRGFRLTLAHSRRSLSTARVHRAGSPRGFSVEGLPPLHGCSPLAVCPYLALAQAKGVGVSAPILSFGRYVIATGTVTDPPLATEQWVFTANGSVAGHCSLASAPISSISSRVLDSPPLPPRRSVDQRARPQDRVPAVRLSAIAQHVRATVNATDEAQGPVDDTAPASSLIPSDSACSPDLKVWQQNQAYRLSNAALSFIIVFRVLR